MKAERNYIVRILEARVERAVRVSGAGGLLVALSGGADSVALLNACARIAPRLGIRTEAINCNFHLRGEESDRDSEFAASLCRRLGVALHSRHYDVKGYMESHPGVSEEMACRELRYADFFETVRAEGLDRVAVAHNADDDIETMLLNMLRGSGSRGLKGMEADNGRVLRPLLTTSRAEIELYLSALGQDYVTDSSNLRNEYRRNFIRRDILPMMESRWSGARKSLSRTVAIMKEEAEIVEAHYRELLGRLTDGDRTLRVYSDGITAGAVLRFLEPFGGNAAVAGEIMEALGKPFARRAWSLDEGMEAVLERDRLVVRDSGAELPEPELRWSSVPMSESSMREVKSLRGHHAVYLPHGPEAYELRPMQTGDRISPLGMKGSRLVSDVVADARLDGAERNRVRVLARLSDGAIVWVAGLKRSRLDLVGPDCPVIYRAELCHSDEP